VICSASSQELPRFGVKVGLKNYAACYATGLLLARRLLKQLGLDETYTGVEEVTGACKVYDSTGEEVPEGSRENGRKFYVEGVEPGERKPFRAFLDIGLRTASRGSRVFAAMKGASDGGMDIPHNARRFPGYDPDAKTFDPEELKERIMGGHIAAYMEDMEEDDEDMFKVHFKGYISNEMDGGDLEAIYEAAHEAIREAPEAVKGYTFDDEGNATAFQFKKTGKEQKKMPKMTFAVRRANADAKKAALQAAD
jgi:large subunit ribosomal protein L5e